MRHTHTFSETYFFLRSSYPVTSLKNTMISSPYSFLSLSAITLNFRPFLSSRYLLSPSKSDFIFIPVRAKKSASSIPLYGKTLSMNLFALVTLPSLFTMHIGIGRSADIMRFATFSVIFTSPLRIYICNSEDIYQSVQFVHAVVVELNRSAFSLCFNIYLRTINIFEFILYTENFLRFNTL